jgi:hypothetical protein
MIALAESADINDDSTHHMERPNGFEPLTS